MNELSQEIYEVRTDLNISASGLSRLIGRSSQYISKLEQGITQSLRLEDAIKIEHFLNITDKRLIKLNQKVKINMKKKGYARNKNRKKIDLHFLVDAEYHSKVEELCKEYTTQTDWFCKVVDKLYATYSFNSHVKQKEKNNCSR